MGSTTREIVIARLRAFIDAGGLKKARKNNPDFAETICSLKPEDIHFGSEPHFYEGYMHRSCTAMGEKRDGDYEMKRTVSLEFNTDTYVFVGGQQDMKLCKYASKRFLNSESLYKSDDEYRLAEKYGKKLAGQELSDLDYWMKEYRLNRCSFVKTDTFTLPIWPIYAQVASQQIFLGYWYEENQKSYTDFKISVPLTKKQSRILFGIIGGIAIVILLLILLLKL